MPKKRRSRRRPKVVNRRPSNGVFQSILMGAAFGVVILATGFFFPSDNRTNESWMINRAMYAQSRIRALENQQNGASYSSVAAELFRHLPNGVSTLGIDHALEKDAIAYQDGKCSAECKARLRLKAESMFGPNWRAVAQKYLPMAKSVKLKAGAQERQ